MSIFDLELIGVMVMAMGKVLVIALTVPDVLIQVAWLHQNQHQSFHTHKAIS